MKTNILKANLLLRAHDLLLYRSKQSLTGVSEI